MNLSYGGYTIVALDNKDGTYTVYAPGSRLITKKIVKASTQIEAYQKAGYKI